MNKLSIARKLWGAMLLLLVAMLMVAGATMWRALVVEREAAAAISAARDLTEKSVHWKGLTDAAIARGMSAAISADRAVDQLFRKDLDEDGPRITKLRQEIAKEATTPEDQAALKVVVQNGTALLSISKKAGDLGREGKSAEAAPIVRGEYLSATTSYLAAIDQFVSLQQQKSKQAEEQANQARMGVLLFGGIGACIIIGLGMVVAGLLVSSIREPLQQSIDVARAIANGDLSKRISTNRGDEFGLLMRELQGMNEWLGKMVGSVRQSTDSISTASSEIASGNQDLSQRTEQTASNLQMAASSMALLSGTVRQSADSARQANQLATSAAEVAARGGDVVSQVVSTMNDINASSKKISDIIGVIDGIAFQTNILALNAAVEAARAGEQGRGFAVVASEVRSLAGRSAEAAREIKSLIGASVERVETGSRLVADAGLTMTEIVGSVQRVSDIIGEISAASAEQSDGIGQITGSVNELDQMTQQNAALVEQSAAAAESLKDQAQRLAQVVSTFKLQ